ncbi:MAG: hypothetical protein RLY86_1845 [Pseudomonadota bacterium]|jgi:molybdenum cofactor cytidylyltransferase
MVFGDLPLAAAEGAILAHSLTLPGFTFRKGRILSADDLARLAAAGLKQVTVAKPGPEDVGEDQAAARIAAPLTGPGISASPAHTGRVNLHADRNGVLDLDGAVLEAMNQVDEGITVATLPPYAVVTAGQMVATVKIIPFAVPTSAVTAVEATAQATGASPLRVCGWTGLRAGLVQTVLPGTRPAVLDKTVEVTRRRLESVGAILMREMRVPHETPSVAAAVERMRADGIDLFLLIGASAVTDRRDVLPAGIVLAGGQVLHLGMPVDPGNLLLLADLGGAPVLGLPGCARSPKPNGVDWVLQRLAAGLTVTPRDIMAMGVGGLLTEIPSRPLPRDSAPALSREPRIAALVLAAGLSRRMGRNKLLEHLDGRPLVAHAVAAARSSRAVSVTLVTGHQETAVESALAAAGLDTGIAIVHAADHARGLSASLKAGLKSLPPEVDGVVVLLGDMPLVTAGHIDSLIAAFDPAAGRGICVPTNQGRRGNPVLWDRRHIPAMLALSGDAGARSLLSALVAEVGEVAVADDGVLRDVDTPDDLAELSELSTATPGPLDAGR